jgi:predicted permease
MITHNLRSAYRNLRMAPGFTTIAILSLGIGIGGTLTMFTLVNAILIKPLDFTDSNRLVFITQTTPGATSYVSSFGVAPIEFLRWRKEIRSLESVGVLRKATVNLTGSGRPQTLGAARVSADLFETLGAMPERGRWFRREEERRGSPDVVILTAQLWKEQFSADTNIIGRKIILDGAPHEVVGVARPDLRFFRGRQLHAGFDLAERTDLFIPARFSEAEEQQQRLNVGWLMIARLRPGLTPAQAATELDNSLSTFQFTPREAVPEIRTVVRPLHSALVSNTRKPLWLLLCAVGFVLMIGCINLANLSLMRTAQRTRELAIRVAVGARRLDLIAYSAAESLLIAIAGTAVGFMVSVWVTDMVVALAPSRVPRLDEAQIDGSVWIFAVAVCGVTAVLVAVLPAWRASEVDPQNLLGTASRGNTETRGGRRIRATLVGAEVCLGTVLAVGSGLMLVSLHHALNVPKGFNGDNVLIGDVTLPPAKYHTVQARERFVREVREQIAAVPGVVEVAATTNLPLETERIAQVMTGDSAAMGMNDIKSATWPIVSPGYFSALDIPLHDGRLLREREDDLVAILSESAARMLWPGVSPIGKRVSRDEKAGPWLRVVGVVGDVLSGGLDQGSTPAIYRAYSQFGLNTVNFVVRTAGLPTSKTESLRTAISSVDADIPLGAIRTMTEIVGKSAQQRGFQAMLLTVFACIAILLAAIGIYGVVAYSVVQRRKEIGVRMALGAERTDVVLLVFRTGMAPVCVGLLSGVVLSVCVAQAMGSLLFGVRTLDPVTFSCAPLVLGIAGALPCLLLARKAAASDPASSLRLD